MVCSQTKQTPAPEFELLAAREFCLMSPEAARAGVSAHSGHGELQCGRVFYPPKFYSDVFLPKTS